jgi:hypothetical protein
MAPSADKDARTWLTGKDPKRLIEILQAKGIGSERRFRLAACACCRQVWGLLGGPTRLLVEYAERYADGEASTEELDVARQACGTSPHLWRGSPEARAEAVGLAVAQGVQAKAVLLDVIKAVAPLRPDVTTGSSGDSLSTKVRCCAALREVFGNPFQPVEFAPAWRTPDVVKFAGDIYREHAFERLSILADALEDAGCADEQVIGHCRQPGEHSRGCWVLDLAMGKS